MLLAQRRLRALVVLAARQTVEGRASSRWCCSHTSREQPGSTDYEYRPGGSAYELNQCCCPRRASLCSLCQLSQPVFSSSFLCVYPELLVELRRKTAALPAASCVLLGVPIVVSRLGAQLLSPHAAYARNRRPRSAVCVASVTKVEDGRPQGQTLSPESPTLTRAAPRRCVRSPLSGQLQGSSGPITEVPEDSSAPKRPPWTL